MNKARAALLEPLMNESMRYMDYSRKVLSISSGAQAHAGGAALQSKVSVSDDASIGLVGIDAGATVAASDDDDDGGDGDSESDRRKSSNKHTPKTVISRPIKSLPDSGFIRLPQVLNTIPVSKSTWWAGIKLGKYPAGIKLSERVTAWRVEDIRALINKFASNAS